MLSITLALVPVLVFLLALQVMDSFKLVRPRTVLTSLLAGAAAAYVCLWWNGWLHDVSGMNDRTFSRYVAPLTEELAKAIFVVFLITRHRVGFLVDAAIKGFAVGAGFAVVENMHYLYERSDATLLLWVIRGLGTAMLHGATTTVFAMLSKTLSDRFSNHRALVFLPGLAASIAIHSAFNHLLLPPLAMTLVILAVLPITVLLVFQRSEHVTRDWVGAGLDLDVELLHLVRSEHFTYTRLGRYLLELKAHFPGSVVADMLCLLRLELELSVQAKAMLMAREAGVDVPLDEDMTASLAELEYLHKSIGPTGLLALKPLQVTSHRDKWHRYLLTQARNVSQRGSFSS